MPSYRVTLPIGRLRVGVDPESVLARISAPAAEVTTVEATNLNVVAGEARATVRFTGDDDAHAAGVAVRVVEAAHAIAECGAARITRRDGGRWVAL